MAKTTLNLTINTDNRYELDLQRKIDLLKKNERFSEFCCQAIKKALNDPDMLEEFNKKIVSKDKEILIDRQQFFDYINKKIAYLEGQINALRYDMHTAAVLGEKLFYKELSVEVLSIIDSLFENIKNSVQLYPGDYIDALRWKQREKDLQDSFSRNLANLKLLEQTFSLDKQTSQAEFTQQLEQSTQIKQSMTEQPEKTEKTEKAEAIQQTLPVQTIQQIQQPQQIQQVTQQSQQAQQVQQVPQQTEFQNSAILEQFSQLLTEINGIKNVLKSTQPQDLAQPSQTQPPQAQPPQAQAQPNMQAQPQNIIQSDAQVQKEPAEEFSGDLSVLSGFFGLI